MEEGDEKEDEDESEPYNVTQENNANRIKLCKRVRAGL